MTFLQPIILAALPLIGLPILIHLINRRRHRTIAWGAMMFLLEAKRMTRGIAKLRYWLIMAMRMLAIAALLFAVARPLASGHLGLALGGAADATLILLDRSASMQQQNVETGESKRVAALRKLQGLLRTVGTSARTCLIESTKPRATPVEHIDLLEQLPETGPTDTASDIPSMMQTALEYAASNQLGRADIWVCSDMRTANWKPDDGRWTGLREQIAQQEGLRFYLLSYPQLASHNLSVSVENPELTVTQQTNQLTLDVIIRAESPPQTATTVPLEFVINGARSVLNIDLSDVEYRLQGHTIALDQQVRSGWGYVALPADANVYDNRYYFVFGGAAARHTVIVSEQPRVSLALRLAVTAPVNPSVAYTAQEVTPAQVDEVDWQRAALVIWQAPLPQAEVAERLKQFVESGRPAIFFPPQRPTETNWLGFQWDDWKVAPPDEPFLVQTWRGDSDLLQHTRSGLPLPIGTLNIFRYCALAGSGQPLASFRNGAPLLQRGTIGKGAFYFCTTLPTAADSSLLRDGVSFFVMLHRALAGGAATLSPVRQLDAGTPAARVVDNWEPLTGSVEESLSVDRATRAGAFRHAGELVALNRPSAEDRTERLDQFQIEQLLQGVDYRIIEEQIGSSTALASEIWRTFLIVMALALIVEAVLCLPERSLADIRLPTYRRTTPVQ